MTGEQATNWQRAWERAQGEWESAARRHAEGAVRAINLTSGEKACEFAARAFRRSLRARKHAIGFRLIAQRMW